jgi:META domain
MTIDLESRLRSAAGALDAATERYASDDSYVTPLATRSRRTGAMAASLLVAVALAVFGIVVTSRTSLVSPRSTTAPATPRDPLEGYALARALIDHQFSVESISEEGTSVPLDTEFPVSLEVRSDLWAFDTSCNGVVTPWRVEHGKVRLRWSGLMTFKGCNEAITRRQDAITRLVREGPVVSFDGRTLVIESAGVRLVAGESGPLPPAAPAGESSPQTLPPGSTSDAIPAAGTYRVDEILIDGTTATVTSPLWVTMADSGVVTIDTVCNTLRAQTSLQADGFHGEFFTTTYKDCAQVPPSVVDLILERLDPFTVVQTDDGRLIISSKTLEVRAAI